MVKFQGRPAKVLVFDSGVGGLSVFKEIQKLLPGLEYSYLFDNAAYPYGELSRETLLFRVEKLICRFVRDEQIDLVVIACNTASTIVLPKLRELLTIPVVGVVPAIKPASLLSNRAVGLVATPATVKREYTHNLINDFSPDKPVKLLGSTRLVDIAEEKLCGKAVDINELRDILAPIKDTIDVAVLGCTHFPLIKDEIHLAFEQKVMLIDSGEAIARRVKSLLTNVLDGNSYSGEYKIFSSAALGDKTALNKAVKLLNFKSIETFPNPDV
ncbi:glutamate racemase [Vibrio sp. JC009]|uniref:glutamate racemase n=1 Tax=Vibrio sp. JC009 TaxID=2912314 RepID=UPI0023AFF8B7|nr:glutamate racemase [Vibrio sp. JC009]WED21734.1 glutamate racemase [Vibrio sp. JC009]